MVIDIREDVPELLEYVRRRVDEHVAKAANVKKLPPVKMIEFGFEFGQANWVALVFDTRPDAEPDGEWTREIDDVMLPRPKWPIWHELPEDAHVYFIDLAGQKVDVMENPDEIICNIVGEAMKHVLLTARQQGAFNKLPKADKCELGVENMEGFYGWPAYEDRGKENLA
jgi:hypothetical protein